MDNYRRKMGKFGEGLAKEFFLKKDYKFIEKNFQKRYGEIDLIFQNGDELVFVEVKTRTTDKFGWGESAVNFRKKEKILKTMNYFILCNPKYENMMPRLDILVVEIFGLAPRFVHYENVGL